MVSIMILLKNVHLYDKEADSCDMLLAGKEIVQIDPSIECSLRAVDTVIDGNGMVAIPGYIDQHVHITGGGGEGGFSNQVPSLRLSQLVEAGVTTVIGLLGTDGSTRSVENLLAKTKALNEEGWTAYCLTGAYEYPSPTITGSVRRDVIFIKEVLGVKIAISDHRGSGITEEDLVRLAYESRAGGVLSGKPGVVHLHVGSGKNGLSWVLDIVQKTDLPVSIFKPTHLGRNVEQAVEFANLGGYIDFTAGRNPDNTAKIVADVLKRVNPALVTVSSDGNGSMPVWNEKKEMIGISAGRISADHDVVKALVKTHGYSLREAISVLTENPARSLGLYPYKGALQEDSCADIILLNDQLEIDTVIANGRIFLEHGEPKYKPKFE